MSSPATGPGFSSHRRRLALVCLLVCASAQLWAQCPVIPPDRSARAKAEAAKALEEEPLLPEAGYLSFTTYTNLFFAFSFDLPGGVDWHPIFLPLVPERHHALLALQYENGDHTGYITATAVDPHPGMEVLTPEEEEQHSKGLAQSGAADGVSPRTDIPDYMLHSGRFYYNLRHKGSNYAAQYWTYINNYSIKVVIATNDQEVLRKAKTAMSHASFYCLQDDRTLTTKEGAPVKIEGMKYEGPTVPTFRVNAALRDQPGRDIPLGGASGATYRNPGLGLQYDFPKGWSILPGEDNTDPPRDDTALREMHFLHACSQTLLRISPPKAGNDTEQAAASKIVFRALDPNCLSMRTATRVSDRHIADQVAADLEEFGEFGEIASDQLVSVSDHVFMVFNGTIGSATDSNTLAKRMSQTIVATRYNKLLLVWSFIAPNASELSKMSLGYITMAGSPPIELRATLGAPK